MVSPKTQRKASIVERSVKFQEPDVVGLEKEPMVPLNVDPDPEVIKKKPTQKVCTHFFL